MDLTYETLFEAMIRLVRTQSPQEADAIAAEFSGARGPHASSLRDSIEDRLDFFHAEAALEAQ